MGLQGHLNDVASDSLPLYLIALFATYFKHLLRSLFSSSDADPDPFSLFESGLGALNLLSDHLSLNRRLSYTVTASDAGTGRVPGPDCVFCLSGLNNGDLVRRLSCRHVFHKVCFDGWLHEMRFTCPLCRSPLLSDELLA